MDGLEKALDDIFVKNAPVKLPENAKKVIVQYLPWLNLIGGAFTLLTAWWLWDWAHKANQLVDYVNSIYQAAGGTNLVKDRLTVTVWLGIVVLVAEGIIYIAAFPGTRDHKKSGWNLLFYGLLLNIVYGLVVMFTDYGGVGSLIGALIGSVVGFYFLFQIRSYYTGSAQSSAAIK
jgi:hypothetical protein